MAPERVHRPRGHPPKAQRSSVHLLKLQGARAVGEGAVSARRCVDAWCESSSATNQKGNPQPKLACVGWTKWTKWTRVQTLCVSRDVQAKIPARTEGRVLPPSAGWEPARAVRARATGRSGNWSCARQPVPPPGLGCSARALHCRMLPAKARVFFTAAERAALERTVGYLARHPLVLERILAKEQLHSFAAAFVTVTTRTGCFHPMFVLLMHPAMVGPRVRATASHPCRVPHRQPQASSPLVGVAAPSVCLLPLTCCQGRCCCPLCCKRAPSGWAISRGPSFCASRTPSTSAGKALLPPPPSSLSVPRLPGARCATLTCWRCSTTPWRPSCAQVAPRAQPSSRLMCAHPQRPSRACRGPCAG